jgi:hypothetical protein
MSDANGTEQEQATAAAPTAIDTIRAQIAELERKLATMGDRREFNRKTRAEAGPPTNTSDKTALGELRGEALRLELEEQDMRAWLEQARRDLAAAEHAELVAADVERARQRLDIADDLRRGGVALDQGVSAARLAAWCKLIEDLGATRLSCESAPPPPTAQQLRVFTVLALKTLLQDTIFRREFEAVAPKDRYTFAQLSNGWADASTRSARAFLEGAGVALEAAE